MLNKILSKPKFPIVVDSRALVGLVCLLGDISTSKQTRDILSDAVRRANADPNISSSLKEDIKKEVLHYLFKHLVTSNLATWDAQQQPLRFTTDMGSIGQVHVLNVSRISPEFRGVPIKQVRLSYFRDGVLVKITKKDATTQTLQLGTSGNEMMMAPMMQTALKALHGSEYEFIGKHSQMSDREIRARLSQAEKGLRAVFSEEQATIILDVFNNFSLDTIYTLLDSRMGPGQEESQSFLSGLKDRTDITTILDKYPKIVKGFSDLGHNKLSQKLLRDKFNPDWQYAMSEPEAVRNYEIIYTQIAGVVMNRINELLEKGQKVISVCSLGSGVGNDTWKICDSLKLDIDRFPAKYEGVTIKFLLMDKTQLFVDQAERLKKKTLENPNHKARIKVAIMQAFDLTENKPNVPDETYDIMTASGFLNVGVLLPKQAENVLKWGLTKLKTGGILMKMGYTPCLFEAQDLQDLGFNVLQMSNPENLIRTGDISCPLQCYIAEKEQR